MKIVHSLSIASLLLLGMTTVACGGEDASSTDTPTPSGGKSGAGGTAGASAAGTGGVSGSTSAGASGSAGAAGSTAAGAAGTGASGSAGTGAGGSAGADAGGSAGTDAGGSAGTDAGGSAGTDAGGSAGTDAGGSAGTDAGGSAGTDAGGSAGTDAGGSAGTDAGGSAGTDAGGSAGTAAAGAAGTGSTDPCKNGVKDGNESGIDCGNAACGLCGPGKGCAAGFQCTSGICAAGQCASPSCTDDVPNGDESDTDCGGSCGACGLGKKCKVPADCGSGTCQNEQCSVQVDPLNFPATVTTISSFDTVDAKRIYATSQDWTVWASDDAGGTWAAAWKGSAARKQGAARVQISRASDLRVLVYAFTDTQTSTYNADVVTTSDAFATPAKLTSAGTSSWGNITALSPTDPDIAYFIGDNLGSRVSSDFGLTSDPINPNPTLFPGGLWTFGSALVSPTSSKKVLAIAAPSSGDPVAQFAEYDATIGTVTNRTKEIETALSGQLPGSFETYRVADQVRIRVLGDKGALAVSDDGGASFTTAASSSSLPTCAGWVTGTRHLVSLATDHTQLASWCSSSSDVFVSRDAGVTWENLAQGGVTFSCSVRAVTLVPGKALLGCNGSPSLAVTY
jgi:hypothetical protein